MDKAQIEHLVRFVQYQKIRVIEDQRVALHQVDQTARGCNDHIGAARDAFDLKQESQQMRDLYGRNTFGQSCLLARRLVEAGTRVVEVIWPKVANSDNHSWDHHKDLTKRMKMQSGPMLDAGLAGLIPPPPAVCR